MYTRAKWKSEISTWSFSPCLDSPEFSFGTSILPTVTAYYLLLIDSASSFLARNNLTFTLFIITELVEVPQVDYLLIMWFQLFDVLQ